MYVCLCNALRESDIRRAIREMGPATPDQVFDALGVKPECRRCIPDIRLLMREEGTNSPTPFAVSEEAS
jgi:bacterioferritin-associated ferredoxin